MSPSPRTRRSPGAGPGSDGTTGFITTSTPAILDADYDTEELQDWLLGLELPAEALRCPERHVGLGQVMLRCRGGRRVVLQVVLAPFEADDAARWGW